MKNLLTLILCSCCIVGFAQTKTIRQYNEWKMDEGGSLTWQFVKEDSTITTKDIIRHLHNFSWVRDIEQIDNSIYARAEDFILDYERYGNYFLLPPMYTFAKWNWSIRVDHKKGKYRFTISNIVYKGMVKDEIIQGSYEDVTLKKDRTDFSKSNLHYLDTFGLAFKSIFNIHPYSLENDW